MREWPKGELSTAMAPLGIRAGKTFTLPLIAVRDASGQAVAQGEAVTDVAGVERSLLALR